MTRPAQGLLSIRKNSPITQGRRINEEKRGLRKSTVYLTQEMMEMESGSVPSKELIVVNASSWLTWPLNLY